MKWRHISCSWRGRFGIIHKLLPNLIYKLDAIKIPTSDFRDTQKLILNLFGKVENLEKFVESQRINRLEDRCCLALRLTAGLQNPRQCGSGDIIYKRESWRELRVSLLSQSPSTHIEWLISTCNSSSRISYSLFQTPQFPAHSPPTYKEYIYIKSMGQSTKAISRPKYTWLTE